MRIVEHDVEDIVTLKLITKDYALYTPLQCEWLLSDRFPARSRAACSYPQLQSRRGPPVMPLHKRPIRRDPESLDSKANVSSLHTSTRHAPRMSASVEADPRTDVEVRGWKSDEANTERQCTQCKNQSRRKKI